MLPAGGIWPRSRRPEGQRTCRTLPMCQVGSGLCLGLCLSFPDAHQYAAFSSTRMAAPWIRC
jgi:hypothetical protein